MISIIANFSQFQPMNCPSCYTSVPIPNTLNGLSLQIGQPACWIPQPQIPNQLLEKYCLCDLLEYGTFGCCTNNKSGPQIQNSHKRYVSEPNPRNSHKEEEHTLYTSPDSSKCLELETTNVTPDCSRNFSGNENRTNSKRDMVNYKVLDGHQYEICDNPDKQNCVNKRLYVCKYEGCDKVFTKTWNLVSHFRIHTNEKPYQCTEWHKLFTQRSNLSRHMAIHWKSKSVERKIYGCTECSRKYSSKYNLNVSVEYLQDTHTSSLVPTIVHTCPCPLLQFITN